MIEKQFLPMLFQCLELTCFFLVEHVPLISAWSDIPVRSMQAADRFTASLTIIAKTETKYFK